MQKVVEFLRENPVQYLSTIGLDGKPKCRPFMFMTECCGKLWFCTNNTKEVYKELAANPNLELCASNPGSAWIRLSGKAVFEDNANVKEECMKAALVKSIYQTASNPIFVVFYIADGEAVIADFSGDPPETYKIR